MMKTISLYVMLAPVVLWPQTPSQMSAPEVTKVIRVHNARPEKLAEMVKGVPATIHANDALKAIVIRGKPADVEALEQTIRELDTSTSVASRNVELMVYLVSGSSAMPPSSTAAEKSVALAPVVKQLRAIFPYSDYQLLSTMLLRSGENSRTTSNGLLKPFQTAAAIPPSTYSIQYDSAAVSPEAVNPTIHLEHFRFNIRIAIGTGPQVGSITQFQTFDVAIQTDVDLHEGQKVVVGKANIETTDSAIFVILSAKLVQ